MSKDTTRMQGKAEEIGGAIKKTVGKVIGSERLEVTGRSEELQGQAHQEQARTAELVKGTLEEVAGNVKKHVGHLLANDQLEKSGKLEELKGQARVDANKK